MRVAVPRHARASSADASLKVSSAGAIDELAAEWDALADRLAAPPWLRPAWIASWWRAFGSGRLQALAARRGGALAGVVPVARRRGALSGPANWHTPEFGVLAEDARVRGALAQRLLAPDARSVRLEFLSGDDPFAGDFREAAAAAGYRLVEHVLQQSPYVTVTGPFERYLETLSRHHVKETRRRRRRLGEHGSVEFALEDGSRDLGRLLADGFRIEASGWKADSGTAIASRRATADFYTEIARWAARRGSLRLAFLLLDGRPIAFELALEENKAFYALKGGFDPEFRRFGPGMLLTYDLLARAFDAGLSSYEFLGSAEDYKLAWTSSLRPRLRLQAFAPTIPGRTEWLVRTQTRPVAKRCAALLGR